jgi:hypothetical protein
MQPLARMGDEQGGAVFDAPIDRGTGVFTAVDDDGFLGGELEGFLGGDFLVNSGVEPEVGWARKMFLSTVSVTDDEVVAGVSDEVLHR